MTQSPGSCVDEELDVHREILHHLAVCPRHGATWEGILEWWLMERAIAREGRRVQRALDDLVTDGWVRRRRERRGTVYYQIPAERLKALERRPGRDAGEDPT